MCNWDHLHSGVMDSASLNAGRTLLSNSDSRRLAVAKGSNRFNGAKSAKVCTMCQPEWPI